MISTAVPPNGKFCAVAAGHAEEEVRQDRDDSQVERAGEGDPVQDEGRYSAVGRPGRMPGMKPPYFFMSSARSSGLNVIDT